MTQLSADAIRQIASPPARSKFASIDVFAEIDSTNSFLMQVPGPAPGKISIAVTSNQTAGRGRHGKIWLSPPGSGLCLSAAYTFASSPENLPALTLALGVGVIKALEALGAKDVELKWPNDLVARNGKLGGILTEVQQHSQGAVTVVTGVGVNLDLQTKLDFGLETDWARHVTGLKEICEIAPSHDEVAAQLSTYLLEAFTNYESSGFAAISDEWARYDWLFGREITIDTADRQFSGVGAGVADDGALLVDTPEAGIRRVTSGTIVIAGPRTESQ